MEGTSISLPPFELDRVHDQPVLRMFITSLAHLGCPQVAGIESEGEGGKDETKKGRNEGVHRDYCMLSGRMRKVISHVRNATSGRKIDAKDKCDGENMGIRRYGTFICDTEFRPHTRNGRARHEDSRKSEQPTHVWNLFCSISKSVCQYEL